MTVLNIHIDFKKALLVAAFAGIIALPSCQLDDFNDPNNPTSGQLTNGATLAELGNIAVGVEASMRANLDYFHDDAGVIGRDFYRFSGSDPRYTQELLGNGTSELDNNAFYIGTPWGNRYTCVKNTNILIEALEKTKATLTTEEKNGILGFAKTIQAHQLLMNLCLTWNNGIRIDVKDPNNLGGIVLKDAALTAIATMLDEADNSLQNAGSKFVIPSTIGSKPADFRKFNRSLAARVQLYRQNYDGVLSALSASYLDMNGDFYAGAYHLFSFGSGDALNPLFNPKLATGELRAAHPSWIADAEAGDLRLKKVAKRIKADGTVATAAQNGLSSDYDVFLYADRTSPVPIIRNEELILIYAEANVKKASPDAAKAVEAINVIRTRHGLAAYNGATSADALMNEIKKQRRYSLFAEGHRWVDMRRWGKLNELPKDRETDDVFEQFPLPISEIQ